MRMMLQQSLLQAHLLHHPVHEGRTKAWRPTDSRLVTLKMVTRIHSHQAQSIHDQCRRPSLQGRRIDSLELVPTFTVLLSVKCSLVASFCISAPKLLHEDSIDRKGLYSKYHAEQCLFHMSMAVKAQRACNGNLMHCNETMYNLPQGPEAQASAAVAFDCFHSKCINGLLTVLASATWAALPS